MYIQRVYHSHSITMKRIFSLLYSGVSHISLALLHASTKFEIAKSSQGSTHILGDFFPII